MGTPVVGATSLGEWGPAPPGGRRASSAYAIPASVFVILGLLIATRSPVGGVAALLLGIGALWLFARSRGASALKDAGARPAKPGELSRVRNLVAGLASDLSTTPPALWVIQGADAGSAFASPNAANPNAMVGWRAGPVIAVAEHLEESLTRTECEAVVAHCLVRIASGEAKATTLRAGMGPFAPTGREAAAADLPAVAITRYPPAMASALEKVRPRTGPFAALWFAPDAGADASPRSRAAALRDL